jgi:hypothetical protein
MSRIVLERIARDIEEVFTAQAAELRELADAISDFAMRARTNGQRTFGYYTDGSKNPEEWEVVESICKAGRTGWTYAKIREFIQQAHKVDLPRPTLRDILIRERVIAPKGEEHPVLPPAEE